MYIYLITIIYLVFFIFIVNRNRGSLLNGFLFFILLILGGLSLVMLADMFNSTLLFYLIAFISALLALLLLSGIFVVLIFSFGSAYFLMKREGRSLSNLLSLLLGICIIALMILGMISFRNTDLNNVFSYVKLVVNTVLFYLIFMFSNYLLSSFVYQIYIPIRKKDYIIVLGSGLIHGNKVSPLLAGRIDKAIKVYLNQKRKSTPPILIMSGGQGKDEAMPESWAMKQYALEHGIPEKSILVEDQSKNTYENMLFSKVLIESKEKDLRHTRILFSTTNYHVFRASLYAKKVHLKAQGIGAKTKFYYWYNALLREYVALLAMKKKTHLICIVLLLFIVLSATKLLNNEDLLYKIARKTFNLQ